MQTAHLRLGHPITSHGTTCGWAQVRPNCPSAVLTVSAIPPRWAPTSQMSYAREWCGLYLVERTATHDQPRKPAMTPEPPAPTQLRPLARAPAAVAVSYTRPSIDLVVRWPLALAFGVVPVALSAWFYSRWLHLFPLIEFRSWLWSSYGWSPFLHSLVALSPYTGSTAPFDAHLTEVACRLNVTCINFPGYVTLLASGYLLYLLVFRLLHSRTAALIAATLWLFSLPVLDSLAWQATLLDKNLIFFSLASLNVALFCLNRQNTSRTNAGLFVAGANVVILVPVILAYNSKQTAWVLVPSLFLLPLVVTRSLSWRSWLRLSQPYVLSTIYATYRIVVFFSVGEGAGPTSLDFGGSPLRNLSLYTDYFANRLTSSPAVILLSVSLLIMTVVTLATYRTATGNSQYVLAWSIASLVGVLILSLFTLYPDTYLMLLPGAFFYICLVSAGKGLLDSLHLPTPTAWLATTFLAGTGAVLVISGLVTSYPLYRDVLTQSHNFADELPLLAQYLPRDPKPPSTWCSMMPTTTLTNSSGHHRTVTWHNLSSILHARLRSTKHCITSRAISTQTYCANTQTHILPYSTHKCDCSAFAPELVSSSAILRGNPTGYICVSPGYRHFVRRQ